MSVVSVITKARGSSCQADSDGRRQYTIKLQVVTDDVSDGPQTVGDALGFEPFDEYGFGNDSDPEAHAKEIEITRSSDSPFIWDVTVNYDTTVEDWDENPLARPTVIDYSFVQFQRVAAQDINQKAIINSAGRYFDPPIEVDDSRLVITMTRNELVFPLANAIAYQDATNSDAWFGLAPGQAKVNNITGKFTKEGGYNFYECVYEFQVRWETWTLNVLDQGLYTKGSGKGEPCKDDDGNAVTEPVPLDGAGNQLSNPNFSNCVFLPFNVYRQLPFSALALP